MTETIGRIASVWFEWQWAMLWQTAVLIGLVAVIDRLIRKRAWPQLRYMLWLLVFVKLILPPGLTSPWSVTSQVPALAQQAVEAGMQTPKAPAAVPAAKTLPAQPIAVTLAETPSITEPLTATLPQAEFAPSQLVQAKSEPLSWTAYAMGVWLTGFVLQSFRTSFLVRDFYAASFVSPLISTAEADSRAVANFCPWAVSV